MLFISFFISMGLLTEIAVRAINIISPKPCAMCGCRLAIGEDVICSSCDIDLPRTHYSQKPYDNEMAKIFWGRIPIEKAAALFFYRAHSLSSRIIYSMKYLNHPEVGELMGRMAAEEFARHGFFNSVDAIVPIPLAKKRLRERGYNQSLEIARGINEITGLPIINNAVNRKNFKGSQTQKDRWQRNENVEDEFILKDAFVLRGKHILIVDDVVTTGATVTACATAMRKCGEIKFSIMSLGLTK